MHIHKITGRSLQFGKVLLAASYNILFTSIVTSIFTQDEQTEKIEQECDQKIQAPLLKEIDKINQDRMYPHIQLTSFERILKTWITQQTQSNKKFYCSRIYQLIQQWTQHLIRTLRIFSHSCHQPIHWTRRFQHSLNNQLFQLLQPPLQSRPQHDPSLSHYFKPTQLSE